MRSVLIIDDNQDITEMLAKYLTIKGFDCTASNNAQNCLGLVKNKTFDYILLDLSMPEFCGVDFLNYLEKEGILKDQKIIVLTASPMKNGELEEIQKDGVIAILKKPVQLKELVVHLK